MELCDLPAIETNVFFNKADANKFIESASYPMIFKLKGGAGSMNVMLLQSKRDAKKCGRVNICITTYCFVE